MDDSSDGFLSPMSEKPESKSFPRVEKKFPWFGLATASLFVFAAIWTVRAKLKN